MISFLQLIYFDFLTFSSLSTGALWGPNPRLSLHLGFRHSYTFPFAFDYLRACFCLSDAFKKSNFKAIIGKNGLNLTMFERKYAGNEAIAPIPTTQTQATAIFLTLEGKCTPN